MKFVVAASAVALVGCNAIFGLEEVEPLAGSASAGASATTASGAGGAGASGGGSGGDGGGVSGCSCDVATQKCVDGICAPLMAGVCDEVHGEPFDDTHWIGVIGAFDAGGTVGQMAAPLRNGVIMAVDELNGLTRHVGVVICDESDLPGAVSHLADTLEVPAIIGPMLSANVGQAASLAQDTMFISPSATAANWDGASNPLVWRTAANDALQGRGLAAILVNLEARARLLNGNQDVQLGLVYHATQDYGLPIRQELLDIGTFNGGMIMAGNNVSSYSYDTAADLINITGLLAANNTEILVAIGGGEVVTDLANPLKQQLNILQTAFTERARAAFEADNTLHGDGVVAINYPNALDGQGGPKDPYNSFEGRYQAQFGNPPLTESFAPYAYDAMILLALALTDHNQLVTGQQLAAAIPNLMSGTLFAADPAVLGNAFDVLSSNGGIDLDGASGPLSFDLMTGQAETFVVRLCSANRYVGYDPYTGLYAENPPCLP